jgi:lipid II:glycine glycyltransferase (peptidoglycan interpeptide bridge formation enzyme)
LNEETQELSTSAVNFDLPQQASHNPCVAGQRASIMQELQAEVDNVTERQWSELIDRFEDANIYQTWAYGSVRWGEQNLSHLILKQGNTVRGLAQLRIMQPGHLNFGIAYLRWGPVCHSRHQDLDADVAHAMVAALRAEYVSRRRLFLEILPNAFAGSSRAKTFESALAKFDRKSTLSREKYRTFLLELTPSLEELRKKLDKKWRNQLNAAERNPLEIVEGESTGDYLSFSDLYAEMRQRKKFTTSVNIEEFGRINERLPINQKMRIFLCKYEGRSIAGVVASTIGNSGIYLLGATTEDAMKLKAAYLLQWSVIRWLKAKGAQYYDLGGIDPVANPGVYHFKSGLSGLDVSHLNSLAACESAPSSLFVALAELLGRSRLGKYTSIKYQG